MDRVYYEPHSEGLVPRGAIPVNAIHRGTRGSMCVALAKVLGSALVTICPRCFHLRSIQPFYQSDRSAEISQELPLWLGCCGWDVVAGMLLLTTICSEQQEKVQVKSPLHATTRCSQPGLKNEDKSGTNRQSCTAIVTENCVS